MDTRLDEVIAISKRIVSLEEEEQRIRVEISMAREQLATLIGQPQPTPSVPMTPAVEIATSQESSLSGYGRRGGFGQRGSTQQVLAYMKTIPGEHVSPDDVAKALDRPGTNEVISRILQRLALAGLIERAHRGLYRFNEKQKVEG